jgi:hypothetical protein
VEKDEHVVIGDGMENWPALLAAPENPAPAATVALENDSMTENGESLGVLSGMMTEK